MVAAVSSLKAKDIMSKEPVTVAPGTSLQGLARIFEENDISGAPVVDSAGRVIGVVTKSDLIRRAMDGIIVMPQSLYETAEGNEAEAEGVGSEVVTDPIVTVDEFMTENPTTVDPDTSIRDVARIMNEGRIHRVIVVDRACTPIGMITTMDMLAMIAGGA